jgi:hypothetical protein
MRDTPRLYRRRKRRRREQEPDGAAPSDSEPSHDNDENDENESVGPLGGFDTGEVEVTASLSQPPQKRSWWQRMLRGKEVAPPAQRPIEDVVRHIQTHAPGPLRWHAYERAIDDETTAARKQRLALLWCSELLVMTNESGADLSLFRHQAQRCASTLSMVGEHDKAALLLQRARLHDEAQVEFARAGDIDAVELAAADERLRHAQGHGFVHAQQQHEVAMTAGDRLGARRLLDQAAAHTLPGAPERVAAQAFARRFPVDGLVLKGRHPTTIMWGSAWLGRSERSCLAVRAPSVAREHVRCEWHEDGVLITPLQTRSPTVWDDVIIEHAHVAKPPGVLRIGPVDISISAHGAAWCLQQSDQRVLLVSLAQNIVDVDGLKLEQRARLLWLLPQAGVTLNGVTPVGSIVLLHGDVVAQDAQQWSVTVELS